MKLNRMQLRRLINETVMQEAKHYSPTHHAAQGMGAGAGALAAGSVGAAVGGAIGFVPGAVVGGTIGLALGSIAGKFGGAKIAEYFGVNPHGDIKSDHPYHPDMLILAVGNDEIDPDDKDSVEQYFKRNGLDPVFDRPHYEESDFKNYEPKDQTVADKLLKRLKELGLIDLHILQKLYDKVFILGDDIKDAAKEYLGLKSSENPQIEMQPEEPDLTDVTNAEVEKLVKEMIRRNLRRI